MQYARLSDLHILVSSVNLPRLQLLDQLFNYVKTYIDKAIARYLALAW